MINILPYNQKKTLEQVRRLRSVTVVLCGISILLGVAGVLLVPTIMTITNRARIAENQVALFEQSGVVAKAVDVKALDDRIQGAYGALATVLPPSPTVYIGTVRTHAPSGIDITSFSLGAGPDPVLQIQGVASTRAVLQNFVTTLEDDPTISHVDSPVSNFVKSTNGTFAILVTFKK